MRNHTTPKIWELSGPQGKSISLTPGTTAQTATWQMTNVPTGKDGRFWYYCTGIIVAIALTIVQSGGTGVAIPYNSLGQCIQSCQVFSPVLGNLMLHANNRGPVVLNLENVLGLGYNDFDHCDAVPAANGTYTRTIYLRLPFAFEFLKKPHETSPWGGFFEGGTVEMRCDVSTILATQSPGSSVTNVTSRCWMEFIPSPEVVIHTPAHFREHSNLPGNATRHTITDMGAPDGLQGIDTSKGVGLGGLYYLTNVANVGLAGAGTALNILSFDVAWRDQTRIDSPDALFIAQKAMMGVSKKNVINTTDYSGFPYTDTGTTTNGQANDASAMFVPFVAPGRDFETSKLQTVGGPKDINVTYTATPSGSPRFVGLYFPTFDEGFVRDQLVPRIAPSKAGQAQLVAKTLNKQKGGVIGVGKLAYVRQKVVM